MLETTQRILNNFVRVSITVGSVADLQLYCFGFSYFVSIKLINRFICLVASKPVKQEVGRTVILPLTKSKLFSPTTHTLFQFIKSVYHHGREPGLVVMGGYSCSKGCRFESWMDIFHIH